MRVQVVKGGQNLAPLVGIGLNDLPKIGGPGPPPPGSDIPDVAKGQKK